MQQIARRALLLLTLAALATLGCTDSSGSSSTPPLCVEGSTRPCACPDGTESVETCSDGWGTCACGDTITGADGVSPLDVTADTALPTDTTISTDTSPETTTDATGDLAGETCTPSCDGKECGSDGCTGLCSACPGAQDACVDFQCVCQPACSDKDCGTDGICKGGLDSCSCATTADCAMFEDGNLCNGTFICSHSVFGGCVIDPSTVVECDGPCDPECSAVTCQPKTAKCLYETFPDGTPCDDGDPATTVDECLDGICTGS